MILAVAEYLNIPPTHSSALQIACDISILGCSVNVSEALATEL